MTGKHEAFMGYKHVLVHLDDEALEHVVPGDRVRRARVRARACGSRVSRELACHSLGPELWHAWAPQPRRRTARGAGDPGAPARGRRDGQRPRQRGHLGRAADRVPTEGLEGLRLGDLVAVRDWDATYYTGYREGAITVGVVSSAATARCSATGRA